MKAAHPSFFVLIGGPAIFRSTLSKTPVLPLFAASLNATPGEIGWIVMASTIPGVLISYPAGALSDHLGKRRVLLVSLVVFATAPFLGGTLISLASFGAVYVACAIAGVLALGAGLLLKRTTSRNRKPSWNRRISGRA